MFSLVFKQLKSGPIIENNYVDSIVMDYLEGLDPDHKETIRQRVMKLSVNNQDCTNKADHIIFRQFCRLYKLLSRLANDIQNYLCVYMKLFSVNNGNQQILVRSKLLTVFKLALRRALARMLQVPTREFWGGLKLSLNRAQGGGHSGQSLHATH